MSEGFLHGFVRRYQRKILGFPGGMYRGECLSIVKQYILERYEIEPPPTWVGAAWGYWDRFPDPLGSVLQRVVYDVSNMPGPGDIVVWRKSSALLNGHIAVVMAGYEAGFVGFEQNWFSKHAGLVWHDYAGIYGWLAPKISVGGEG